MQLTAVYRWHSETVPYSSEKQVGFMLLQPGRNPNVLTENKVTSCKVKIAQTASVLHMPAVLSKYIQSTVQAQNTKCFPTVLEITNFEALFPP